MRLLLPIVVVGLALGGLRLRDAPAADDEQRERGRPLTFRYRDDDGDGQLRVTSVAGDPRRPGVTTIAVELEQGGRTFRGSGVTVLMEDRMPSRTVYAFALNGSGASYFFQGETTSGVTLAGGGRYHPVGRPEASHEWSIVLGR